jgi:hypothetical protein
MEERMRKWLLGLCAAAAIAVPVLSTTSTPAEARPIRICVQWTYYLKLVKVGGVYHYVWVRDGCRRYITIDIPILQRDRLRIPVPPPPPELGRLQQGVTR